MTLPARPLHVPAGLPIDELTRPELLDVGAANLSNINVRQTEQNALEKRLGFTSLTKVFLDNSSRSTGYRLLMNGTQPCCIDGTNLDVYSETMGLSVVKARVPEVTYRMLESPSPNIAYFNDRPGGDSVTVVGLNGTYVVTAWAVASQESTYVAYVSLVDAANGAVILPITALESQVLASNLSIRLATYSTYVLAFVFDANSNQIHLYYLNTASRSSIDAGWSASSTLATDYSADGCAASLVAVSGCAIAYVHNAGGTSRVAVRTCNASGLLSSTTINTSSTTPTAVGISEGSTTLWVSWNESLAVKACGLNESGLAVTATTATVLTAAAGSITHVFVGLRTSGAAVYAYNANLSTRWRAIALSAGATVTAGSEAILANTLILSRPFLRNGRLYAHFASENWTEMILCDCTPDTTSAAGLATWLRPVCAPIQREIFAACSYRTPQVSTTTKYLFGFAIRKSGTTYGAALVEYDFANPYRWKPAELNGSTFLSGGVTSVFDGSKVFEAGFLIRPYTPTLVSIANAGNLTFALGGRRYITTYEDLDADGNWHVSGVSTPTVLTGNCTNKKSEITVRPLSISSRGFTESAIYPASVGHSVRIGLWGTLDGGNPPYYRIDEIVNDPQNTAIAYSDNLVDGTLATQALLYGTGSLPGTNGAGQDHRAPPGLLFHISYNGMLVGATGKTLWYSGQPVDGEGTWFSPVFAVNVDDDVTGLTVQDGSILIFTRASVWTVAGEPPSDNGASGGLGTPRKLAVDHGCINANSIVTTSAGTFYQSTHGLELLTRSLSVVSVGDRVQDTLAAYPVITAAVLDTKHGLVRFSLATSQTDAVVADTGRDLVWDLTLNSWVSVDDKRGSSAGQASQDACMLYIAGAWRYCWLIPAGTLYYERDEDDASAHIDVTTWIDMEYEIPPLKLGLQQDMRSYEWMFLFERHSAAGLTIEVANDFGAYNVESSDKVWTESDLSGRRQVPFRPKDSGMAVQVRVKDTAPVTAGTGKGFTFIGISADVAPKQGPTRGTPRLATSLRR